MSTFLNLDRPTGHRRPLARGRLVVTKGKFGGVHGGHQSVINHAQVLARQVAANKVVAVMFHPDPLPVLRPELALATLTTLDLRASHLRDAGVDNILVLTFDRRVASRSTADFADQILIDALQAPAVIVGTDFRFGSRSFGSVATLSALERHRDFLVEGIPLSRGQHVWSSTDIRACLVNGDVTAAGFSVPPSMRLQRRVATPLACSVVPPGTGPRRHRRAREQPVANRCRHRGAPRSTVEITTLEPITDRRTRRRP